jgi:hypothetical protein
MKTAQRLTPAQRNRAIQRLRVLKAGATFVGVSATLGFSWLAAMSNPGTQAAAAATTPGDSTIPSSTSTSSSSSTSTSISSSFGSIFIGGGSGGRTHATSGGS